MSIEIEFASEEDIVNIYAEFNATKESVQRDVKYLMEWLEKQPHLPNVKDEEFLANFLIRCKNSLEKTKNRLHTYYVCKSTFPELYSNRIEMKEKLLECWKLVGVVPLPKLTPEKRRVVIHAFSPLIKAVPVTTECITKLYTAFLDISVKSDPCKGTIVIYDCANLNSSFATTFFSTCRLGFQILLKGPPIRLHKIYVLNLLPAFQGIVQMLISLAPKKIVERIVFWSKSPTDLVEELPRNVLPSDYGGEEASLTELKDALVTYFEQYFKWLGSADITDKADLSKMPPQYSEPVVDSSFGLNGSFRQISFD